MTTAELLDRFEACILAGAIGDAWGSSKENQRAADPKTLHYWAEPKTEDPPWAFTDDTQLTSATCLALADPRGFSPEVLSAHFVDYFQRGKISRAGASTLKALIELEAGIHWRQTGRTGEHAAGNGAAMRIAPLAFFEAVDNECIRSVCRITHRNDEAYVGALAVVTAIRQFNSGGWQGGSDLFDHIAPMLPDSRLRDRMIEIADMGTEASIQDIAGLGTTGYVVHSIPLALFAASRAKEIGIVAMFENLIAAGGDTDTNASIAGQVAGTVAGTMGLPVELVHRLRSVPRFDDVQIALGRGCAALERQTR